MDRVYLKDFQYEYESFCKQMKIQAPSPITKRAMAKQGVTFERLNQQMLRQERRWRIHFEHMINDDSQNDPWLSMWWFYDIFSVFAHFF